MAKLLKPCLLVILVSSLAFGSQVHAVPYDHRYTHKCLAKPHGPQYGGGIVVNPELNEGLKGWTNFGEASIEQQQSQDGNNFIIASKRNQSFHSFTQKFYLEKEKLYAFSAWLRVSYGSTQIAAIFKTPSSYETAGWVIAKKGCWSMLKGGLIVNVSGPAYLYFESNQSSADVWADSISLQPFSKKEWISHQHHNIEKFRKRRVKFRLLDQQNQPIANARISIKQTRSKFPLGCAINYNILDNPPYQKWFTSRFKHTVFENELKWYMTAPTPNSENYSIADSMTSFAKSHDIAIRGHNVFWDDPRLQPWWVWLISTNEELLTAMNTRINSVMQRYSGQLFHWDVMNENLHFTYFEDKLGPNASTIFFQQANVIDPIAIPFLNDYNTIEQSKDELSTPAMYLQRISDIRMQGYKGPLGIGLESHFWDANLPYVRASLDILASAKLPIWITELDVHSGPNQATYLELIMRELLSHYAVRGIMIWGAWRGKGCYRMCLTDNNFNNLATGDVVDKIIWELNRGYEGTTNSQGSFEASMFYGEYEFAEIINHQSGINYNCSVLPKFNVGSKNESRGYFHFKINATQTLQEGRIAQSPTQW